MTPLSFKFGLLTKPKLEDVNFSNAAEWTDKEVEAAYASRKLRVYRLAMPEAGKFAWFFLLDGGKAT